MFGCISVSNKKAYLANTSEFLEKEKEFTISADSATQICANYRFKTKKADTINTYLYLIYEGYYVFANNYRFYNLKTQWYYLPGIWVNGNTGKIKRVEGEKYVQLHTEILGYYQKQFIRNTSK